MVDGRSKGCGRKRSDTAGMEAFCSRLRAEFQADRWIFADLSDCPPQGEELFRVHEHPRLLKEVLGKSSLAQYASDGNSQFFQFESESATMRKCLFIRSALRCLRSQDRFDCRALIHGFVAVRDLPDR